MPFRRCLSAVGLTLLILAAHPSSASAHGVEVTARVDQTTATLELTDETGEVCISVEPALANMAVAAIADDTDEIVLILGENFEPTPACQFFDVDTVNAILADVDAHRLVIASGSTEASGVLVKPPPPESETALVDSTADDGQGPNTTLVFVGGLALGIAIVVVRKRLRRRGSR